MYYYFLFLQFAQKRVERRKVQARDFWNSLCVSDIGVSIPGTSSTKEQQKVEKTFEDWYRVAEDVWRYPKKQKKSDTGPRWELFHAGREY